MLSFAGIAALGACIAVVFLIMGAAVGLTDDRGAWTVTLIAIALFYVVFAVDGTHATGFLFNVVVGLCFIGFALLGHVTTMWWTVLGLLMHMSFDVAYHAFESNPAPHWWGPICLGIDGVLAIGLIIQIRRGVFHEK